MSNRTQMPNVGTRMHFQIQVTSHIYCTVTSSQKIDNNSLKCYTFHIQKG